MKFLIITKSTTGTFACFIDAHPEQMSDFRDRFGNPCTVEACVEIDKAVAALAAIREEKPAAEVEFKP